MILTMLLLAAQPEGAPPAEPHACAPRQWIRAGAPPPAVLSARRIEIGTGAEVALAVHRCGGEGFRVERHREGRNGPAASGLDWIPVAQCPALGRWYEAAGRLRLPAPMLTAYRSPPTYRGTWFTLRAPGIPARGRTGNVELEILHPPGAGPSVLSAWFGEGERLFQICRDRGNGGEGRLPWRPRPPQSRPPSPRP